MPVPQFLTLWWRLCFLLCAGSAVEMRWKKLLSSFPKTDHQDIVGSWGAGWHSFILSRCSACFEFHLSILLKQTRAGEHWWGAANFSGRCSFQSRGRGCLYLQWELQPRGLHQVGVKSSPCTVVQDKENAWADILHRGLNKQWDGPRTLKNYHQNVNSHYGL